MPVLPTSPSIGGYIFYIYPKPGYTMRHPVSWQIPAPHGVATCDDFSPDGVLSCCLDSGHAGDRHMAFTYGNQAVAESLMAEWSVGAPSGLNPTPAASCILKNPWVLSEQCRLPQVLPAICSGCFQLVSSCLCKAASANQSAVSPPTPPCPHCGQWPGACVCKPKSSAPSVPTTVPTVYCGGCLNPHPYGQSCTTPGCVRASAVPLASQYWANMKIASDSSSTLQKSVDRCECGSFKALGTGKGQIGHSDWCPWSAK